MIGESGSDAVDLQEPLCSNGPSANPSASSSSDRAYNRSRLADNGDQTRLEDRTHEAPPTPLRVWLGMLALDTLLSISFWYVVIFVELPDNVFWAGSSGLLASMVLWRVARGGFSSATGGVQVPYTCGYAAAGGKELFIVATVHISPRAPRDVEAVIESASPDITMIELDEERLDRMRDVQVRQAREPKPEDLQPVTLEESGQPPVTLLCQRAAWNAERVGEVVSGEIVFHEDNAFALATGEGLRGKIALIRRGTASQGFSPLSLKAHNAARCGAEAVLMICPASKLPAQRIGTGSLRSDLRVALLTGKLGFPRIPLLLLPKEQGELLLERCHWDGSTDAEVGQVGVRAQFQIMPDNYPRRTLLRKFCQACALMFSGIGILYGVIQCFAVEVGAEFTRAEVVASSKGIPCVCVDVDMNGFWSRLGWSLVPTPLNVGRALWAWLGFPRVLACMLFPPKSNVDVIGSTVLHLLSLPARTWVAFLMSGFLASFVMGWVFQSFCFVGEQGGEAVGVVQKQDRDAVQVWLALLLELFAMPRVYEAVADSRDEVMYRSIVAKSREFSAQRLVVVVGAGHSNGILHRVRTRGL